MRTLVVEGDWLLRRCHYGNLGMNEYSHGDRRYCGGIVGFMNAVRMAISNEFIDKVVVAWNGAFDGWDKYGGWPTLKAKKEIEWNLRVRVQSSHSSGLSSKDVHELQIIQQRNKLQRYFDMIDIRQMDDERSEAMDAIALYVNEATTVGEEILILSREHEFSQLVGDRTSILLYDGNKVTQENFLALYGYEHSNDLMLKCFTGMPDKVVDGVKGLTIRRMTQHFVGLKLEHYPYDELIAYARRKRVDTKRKVYDAVISAHDIVHRNARLINFRDPIFNSNLSSQKNYCLYSPLEDDQMAELKNECKKEKYETHFNMDIDTYFEPFQRILLKEKEYTQFHEQVNI